MKKIIISLFSVLIISGCSARYQNPNSNMPAANPISGLASSTHIFVDGIPSPVWSPKYKFYIPVTSPLEQLYSQPNIFYSFTTPDLRHDLQIYFLPKDEPFNIASGHMDQYKQVSNIKVKNLDVELTQYKDNGNILTMAAFRYSPSLKVVMIGRNLSKQNIVEMIESVGNSFDNPKLY